ncbi:hypothetical protein [Micromonospora sp. WMMD812]|uniref:hypothetical protein n=1 Tax=Micromonospora sp. WMMD812 TaxID=3015152 RepID=UPI00248AB144|nr:hypothetical protein [Micromonospora sp. WMMD812]WBB65533.1 hypothetical protein O7603_20280 [Micromonospora sp. WMMD812]
MTFGPAGRSGLFVLAFGTLAFFAVLRDLGWVALLAALGWQATYVWSYDSVSWPVATAIIVLAVVVLIKRTHSGALPGFWWLSVPAVTAIFWGPYLLSESVYLFRYQQVMMLTVVALCAVGTLLDSRAAFAAVGLLLAEVLNETVAITWAGDNPAGEIFYAVSVSWWSAVMGTTAAALLVGGHLVALRRASL